MRNFIIKRLLLLGFIIFNQDIFAQKYLLSNELIGVDYKLDSLFRINFYKLENFEQRFIVKYPEFSLLDFYEPTDSEIYKFVIL